MDALRASLPGGHAVGRAEDPRDADHRRARAGQARALRRRGRLPLLHGRPRHLHLHPLRAGQGRARARAGRRRASWPTRTPATRCARPRPRRARCSRRSSWPASRGTGRDTGPRDRQLRLVHLQPRPVPGRAGRRARGGAQRRATPTSCSSAAPDRVVVSPGPVHAGRGGRLGARRSARFAEAGTPGARRLPRPPGAGRGVRRARWCAASRCTARPPRSSTTAGRSSPGSNPARGRALPLAGRGPRRCPTASSAPRAPATW